MLKFLLKILFLLEIIIGVELFFVGLFISTSFIGINAILVIIGLIFLFDGLERLDGPEHGPY